MTTLYREFTTRSQIDAEYDVEQSVPDFTVYARQWAAESERARRELPHHLNVRYGPTLDEHLDIFPAAQPNAPVLLFIHGGYWRILSARDNNLVARGPVAAGITVVCVNYALCPRVSLDEISRQIRAAVAWTHRHIAEYHGNPDRIFVSGHSAGGQLTLQAMQTDWPGLYGLPRNVVKGGYAISGVFDLRPLRYSFLQSALRLDDERIQRNSPALNIAPSPTPLLVSVGGDESSEFRRQSADFLADWKARGNIGHELPLPGHNHFTAIMPLAEPGSEMVKSLCSFMNHTPNTFMANRPRTRLEFGRLPSSGLAARRPGGRS